MIPKFHLLSDGRCLPKKLPGGVSAQDTDLLCIFDIAVGEESTGVNFPTPCRERRLL